MSTTPDIVNITIHELETKQQFLRKTFDLSLFWAFKALVWAYKPLFAQVSHPNDELHQNKHCANKGLRDSPP